MAKRKLSAEKRAELRQDLKKGKSGGKKIADLLREVAAKFGITTITARWYLKSLDGTPTRRGPGRPGRLADPSARMKELQAQLTATKAAARLEPRLQRLAEKEAALRSDIARSQRKLNTTVKKAAKLQARMEKLLSS